ncbi:MAG: protein kinase, partial [Candidatus Eisenbacteria bacterium]|nr:protein kinase [Candidatus Eisenbacteria bacterium]
MTRDDNTRKRIEELFHLALERPAEERPSFLRAQCGEDSILCREVEALLNHYEAASGGFLEEPLLATQTGAEDMPRSVGPYRIVRQIGEGAMGVVYEAEQERPRRRIAIKVLRPGLYGESQLRRFRLECDILGQLTHPGIAHVYDAGDAEVVFTRGPRARLPYMAMELVRGRGLLDHVDHEGLDRKECLALFADICDAVHHAHSQAVIHRDLKPNNILVDETGQPKVLDFGVARTAEAGAGRTRQTRTGDIIGTLRYMSPEQLSGEHTRVDIQSDVYSLGVILFELLVGAPPYGSRGESIAGLMSRMGEGRVPRPSRHDASLRGDLDAIVGFA